MIKKFIIITAISLMYLLVFEGCHYDKADVLYPSNKNDCDTTTVRLSVEIKSILDANCKSCHEEGAFTGIDLYDYNIISALALDGDHTYGSLLSSVLHKGGAPPMPDGEPQLQECDLNKIAAWVHAGAPDN